MTRRLVLILAATAALGACSQNTSCAGATPEQTTDPLANARPTRPADVPSSRIVEIAFLGDSLTAGLGLNASEAYPSRIQELFAAEGYGEVECLNGGISGDTTAGGRRRYEQLLTPSTKILVVALGGNDALRGLTVEQTHDNIAGIVQGASAKGLGVLLAGMEAPTNLGDDYRQGFRATFARVAREQSPVFVPFLLEGVAGNPALNQADGIHPTAEGQRIIANLLYPKLRDMVDQISNTVR